MFDLFRSQIGYLRAKILKLLSHSNFLFVCFWKTLHMMPSNGPPAGTASTTGGSYLGRNGHKLTTPETDAHDSLFLDLIHMQSRGHIIN